MNADFADYFRLLQTFASIRANPRESAAKKLT